MKEYNICKSYLFYTQEEEDFLKEDIQECEKECDREPLDEDELQDRMYDYINMDFEDFMISLKNSKINNNKYVIIGTLGLWDGRKEIYPYECDTLEKAIWKCLNDMYDYSISEDQYGNLNIVACHHDGRNYFTIKKVTPGGLRCVHLRKEIWG